MPDKKGNVFLYEAIELRAEYDARIKALKSLLPEAKENRSRLSFGRDDEVKRRPVDGFSIDEVRDEMQKIEFKKRVADQPETREQARKLPRGSA
jgi:hypothetical protein